MAAYLIQDIEAGLLTPGSPLPSENELVQQYGVARNTAPNAVAHPRDLGYVYTVPKRGTYVKDREATDE
ncbi:winged helix-turn-helix domain-containing protein [Streptomyces sp. NPDC037389]|uniref:winged helix-turn-helix domain-containing protein n=1 Tax=Streptomyces sp. NPDC037389 TaxID=3155369 RepID=UPI0033C05AAA